MKRLKLFLAFIIMFFGILIFGNNQNSYAAIYSGGHLSGSSSVGTTLNVSYTTTMLRTSDVYCVSRGVHITSADNHKYTVYGYININDDDQTIHIYTLESSGRVAYNPRPYSTYSESDLLGIRMLGAASLKINSSWTLGHKVGGTAEGSYTKAQKMIYKLWEANIGKIVSSSAWNYKGNESVSYSSSDYNALKEFVETHSIDVDIYFLSDSSGKYTQWQNLIVAYGTFKDRPGIKIRKVIDFTNLSSLLTKESVIPQTLDINVLNKSTGELVGTATIKKSDFKQQQDGTYMAEITFAGISEDDVKDEASSKYTFTEAETQMPGFNLDSVTYEGEGVVILTNKITPFKIRLKKKWYQVEKYPQYVDIQIVNNTTGYSVTKRITASSGWSTTFGDPSVGTVVEGTDIDGLFGNTGDFTVHEYIEQNGQRIEVTQMGSTSASTDITTGSGSIDDQIGSALDQVESAIGSDGNSGLDYKLYIGDFEAAQSSTSTSEHTQIPGYFEYDATTSTVTLVLTNMIITTTTTEPPDIGIIIPGQKPNEPYVSISGFVWEDTLMGKANYGDGTYSESEERLQNIHVIWYNAIGIQIEDTYTDANGEYIMYTESPVTDHPYKVNILEKFLLDYSYVAFEYDGVTFTTTLALLGGDRSVHSQAIETLHTVSTGDGASLYGRQDLNEKFQSVTRDTINTAGNVTYNYKFTGTQADAINGTKLTYKSDDGKTINSADESIKVTATAQGILAGGWMSNYSDTKVLQLGTYCLDHCYWGIVEAISDKAPKTSTYNHTSSCNLDNLLGLCLRTFEPIPGISEQVDDHMLSPLSVDLCDGLCITIPTPFGAISLPHSNPIYCNILKEPGGPKWTAKHHCAFMKIYELALGSHCIGGHNHKEDDTWEIYNVNCGLIRREQPDIRIKSDIEKVDVIMKGQQYTYTYGTRGIDLDQMSDEWKMANGFTGGLISTVKDLALKFSGKYSYEYVRKVNPSDIAYIQEDSRKDEYQIYVTYDIVAINESNTILMSADEIIAYYDARYELAEDQEVQWNQYSLGSDKVYKGVKTNALQGIYLEPQTQTDIIRLKLKVTSETLQSLARDKTAYLKCMFEIYTFSAQYGAGTIYSNGLPDLTNTSGWPYLQAVLGDAVGVVFNSLDQVTGALNDILQLGSGLVDGAKQIVNAMGGLGSNILSLLYNISTGSNINGQQIIDGLNTTLQVIQDDLNILQGHTGESYAGLDKDSAPGDTEVIVRAINEIGDVADTEAFLTTLFQDISDNVGSYITGGIQSLVNSAKNGVAEGITGALNQAISLDTIISALNSNRTDGSDLINKDMLTQNLIDGISGAFNNAIKNFQDKLADGSIIEGLLGDNVAERIANDLMSIVIGQLDARFSSSSELINNPSKLLSLLEDDLDTAPTFTLTLDEEYRNFSGYVWEDQPTGASLANRERLGNGYKEAGEAGVENVQVELWTVDDSGQLSDIAMLYELTSDGSPVETTAITYTDSSGNFRFTGLIEDYYIVRYVYGNGTTQTSKISGEEINARNFKSTIIPDGTNVRQVMTGTYGSDYDKWHLTMDTGANVNSSIAVDNIEERLTIDSLKYSNFNEGISMSAYSPSYKLQIEYTKDQTYQVGEDGNPVDGTVFSKDLPIFHFGIIERPREDIIVDKTIQNLKLVLANGQVLIDGNPYTDGLNYLVALGPEEGLVNTREIYRKNRDKLIRIEMDIELIHGATLDITYRITVTNNDEKDYEYDVSNGGNTDYYYYGINGVKLIRESVELLADYLDSELVCMTDDENFDWQLSSAEYLRDNGLISDATYNQIITNEYTVYTTESFKDLASGESKSITLHVSKVLAAQGDSYVYDNHVEFLQLNGKIARTIDSVESSGSGRHQVMKTYKMGNYLPSLTSRRLNDDITLERAGLHEQDDDTIVIRITPPTGIVEIVGYIAVAIVALVVISLGIILIKKKVISRKS